MNNDFGTGKPMLDMLVFGIAWILALINWGFVTGLFSIMASLFVIVSKYQEMRDRNRKNKKR
jgi:hypothetical protein